MIVSNLSSPRVNKMCIRDRSCSDYLDSDYIFRDRETIEKVFTDRDKTEAWLANAFSYLSDACADVCNKRVTPHCFADDMYYGDDDGSIQESKEGELSYNEFKEGLYDENTKQGMWERCCLLYTSRCV